MINEASRTTVLISEPQAFKNIPYLPYMGSVLKTYCEQRDDLSGRIQWLDPLYKKESAEVLLSPHRDTRIDVLGLSCYMWNWDVQCDIAQRVKAAHPECLVVAGGPHPDYKDPNFFSKHPYIDMVAVKDGEITFTKILSKVVAGVRDYRDIGGLYLPNPDGGATICTGPAEVPRDFEVSPYIEQSAYYETLIADQNPGHFNVIWETNRGCPYSCSFCDWGSNTMSKLRRFGMERVKAEVEWFARMKINYMILADANFAILPRDLEIADYLNTVRAKEGFPLYVHYSPAKNNPDRTVEVSKKFAASGISPVHVFAVQHTSDRVLACMERSNISIEKQRQAVRDVTEHNIPTLVQLITGVPGDTYEDWKACHTDLMEWGLHDNCQVFNYSLLPNAPAAEKSYMDTWAFETVVRNIPQEGTGQRRKDDLDSLVRTELIIQSKTYSREDWVRMKIYTTFVRALHHRGLTKLIAVYLRFSHDVSYRDFYDGLIEDFFGYGDLYARLTRHFHRFLAEDDALIELELEAFPDHPVYFEATQWVFVHLCLEFEEIMEKLKSFLMERFPLVLHLESVIDYQRNLVFLPDYDPTVGKTFFTDFDWKSYFDRALFLTEYEPLEEPAFTPKTRVEVRDQMPAFTVSGLAVRERWLVWINCMREVQRVMSVNFEQVYMSDERQPSPARSVESNE